MDQQPIVSSKRSARELNSVPLFTREECSQHTREPLNSSKEIKSSRRESNPRFLFVREASLPLDHGTLPTSESSSTGGIRTHRHQTLELIAMPIRVPCLRSHHATSHRDAFHLRARESNHGLRAYETRPSTSPPARPRPRYRAGQAGFMRTGWTPAAPGDLFSLSHSTDA